LGATPKILLSILSKKRQLP